jgi:cyclopropane fatty-acyl-phospholipid synthase-like methyltransferase
MESAKSMKLYDRVERVLNELRANGIADDAPLTVAQLVPYDQYHYHGTDAVDLGASRLGLGPESRVLDVGAGIGGPARWLAATTGCHVTALELQPDLNATAADLTRRCGLADRVTHVAGDILDGAPVDGGYDAVISYLAVLHIPDRARLFAACHRALVPGGGMYIEDFTLRSEPTPEQREVLRVKVQCPYVPPPDTYRRDILDAGFAAVDLEDVTADWTAFTADRLAASRADRERLIRVHGQDVADGLEDFFATMADLYADGVLGGARILAHR